jgi:hypothetical protein
VDRSGLAGTTHRFSTPVSVENFYLRPRARYATAVAMFVAGAVVSVALRPLPLWSYAAVAVFAATLATTIGLGKTTTACGLNVLSYLSGQTQPGPMRSRDAAIYVATCTFTAGVIGLGLGRLGEATGAQRWPIAAVVVLVLAGLLELDIVRLRFVPTLRWQVPVDWVSGRRAAPVIWGVLLGSGLSTLMPFASFFGLLVFAVVAPAPAGAAVMAVYGLARAIPALGVVRFGSGLVEELSARSWELRLTTHMAAGCLTIALGGTLVGALL